MRIVSDGSATSHVGADALVRPIVQSTTATPSNLGNSGRVTCPGAAWAGLLSFRMISDTRIECQNADSERQATRFDPTGSHRGGVESGGSGSIVLDGFLWSLPQRGSYLPSFWHQSPKLLSLAAAL